MVGISLLTLVPGRFGGSESYVRDLLRALRNGDLGYRVFVPTIARGAGEGLPEDVVHEYLAGRSALRRVVAMATARRARRRLDTAAAVHYPFTVALPRATRPFAVTLHDVLHHDRPELFPRAEALYRRFAYDRSARLAHRVIVPSAFTRDRAAALLRLPADRFRVVHHGIDARFSPGSERREAFLLYPARPWPHKNHDRLFDALELLPGYRLVLTGGGHDARALPARVEARGHVAPDELVSLYRRAAAVVFPSLYEGFGAPPLEALACAAPVAVSDIPPLREVCGDSATYFDPTSAEAIAAGVEEAIRRGGGDGPARAARFTWTAAARAHEDVYRELIAAA